MDMLGCVLIFCTFFILHCDSLTQSSLNPVILIPGIEGSQIFVRLNKTKSAHWFCEKQSDFFNIWLNPKEMIPPAIDCFTENLRLKYDPITNQSADPEGVQSKINDFGNTETIEYLSQEFHIEAVEYFHHLVQTFVDRGYVRNRSIRAAPYDFRRTPNELTFNEDLKALVEETFVLNGGRRVSLVAHSYGCLMTLYFLNRMDETWKNNYIASFTPISGPWAGSMLAYKSAITGDNMGLFFVSSSKVRNMERTYPSIYMLMPNGKLWSNDVLLQSPLYNLTAKDYDTLFSANLTQNDMGDRIWHNVKDLTSSMVHPGVNVNCVYGVLVPTVQKLIYSSSEESFDHPKVIYGDGDGTVNRQSLEACALWQTESKFTLSTTIFPKTTHLGIILDDAFINYLFDLVNKYQFRLQR